MGYLSKFTKNTIFLFALICCFTSCRFNNEQEPINPQFDFQEIRFQDLEPNSFFWANMEDEEFENKPVRLELSGIYALDKDVVFIFGQLDGIGYGRSIVLKSSNSGKSWYEVAEPKWGNTIFEMQILPNGTGWLVSQWVIEGPGPMSIYRTDDYGDSWYELNQPPSVNFGFFYGMKFFDEHNGQLKIASEAASLIDHLIIFETRDGGDSWSTYLKIPKFDNTDPENDDFSANYSVLDIDRVFEESSGWKRDSKCTWLLMDCLATSSDGTTWRIKQVNFELGYQMRFKKQSTTDWTNEFTIPNRFVYSDGIIKVLEPQEEK